MTAAGVSFHRSESGYGWWIDFGKRVRWSSRKATTPMWPRVRLGSDENCNRALSLILWPLGCLDVWWEPKWRTDADGMCDDCKSEFRKLGVSPGNAFRLRREASS